LTSLSLLQSPSRRKELLLDTAWIFLFSSALHFLYELTGLRPVSYIAAVNESTWEHIKIIFFSALFYDLYLYLRKYRGNPNFFTGLALGLFSIILSVPILFYGYSASLGFSFILLDLMIAFIAALISQYILMRCMESSRDLSSWRKVSILFILAMTAAFLVFTWYPPQLPLFRDPQRR